MLSTHLRTECCDAPLWIDTSDFTREHDIVSCHGCGVHLGVVTDDDWVLLNREITPGDQYPDHNDTGKHHIEFGWIPPEDMAVLEDRLRAALHRRAHMKPIIDPTEFRFYQPPTRSLSLTYRWLLPWRWGRVDRPSDFTKITAV